MSDPTSGDGGQAASESAMNPDTQRMLAEFEARTAVAFPNLRVKRADFAAQIRRRVSTPDTINQGDASLCGPAAFLYCLLKKNPMAYAKFAIDLFETGSAWIGHMKVEPSDDCLKANVTSLDAVDWVTLAGLRDAKNLFLDYDSPSVRVAGITNVRSVANWFSKCGYFSHVARETSAVRDKTLSTLVRASRHLLAGRWPCMLIGSNVLAGKPRGRAFPDHWVVLASEVRIDNSSADALFTKGIGAADPDIGKKTIALSVISWGSIWALPPMTVDNFLDYFYGYVVAQ